MCDLLAEAPLPAVIAMGAPPSRPKSPSHMKPKMRSQQSVGRKNLWRKENLYANCIMSRTNARVLRSYLQGIGRCTCRYGMLWHGKVWHGRWWTRLIKPQRNRAHCVSATDVSTGRCVSVTDVSTAAGALFSAMPLRRHHELHR